MGSEVSQEAKGYVQHSMGLPWLQVAPADMGQERGAQSSGLPTRSHSGPQVPAACRVGSVSALRAGDHCQQLA